jgi:hypothetical protein
MDENKTPVPETPPAAQKPQLDWSAIRDAAFSKVTTRVRALQNLEKINKAGVPSLYELNELFTGMATCLAAIPREVQKQGEVLYTMLVNFSLRLDAMFAILEEKGIAEKGALQAKMTTILEEQKALFRQRKEDALAKSVEQVKKSE